MSNYLRTLRTALYALRRNVLRSILTCLGIIIGVGAVIAMMEIGSGSSRKIHDTMALMGADNIIVWPGTAQTGGVSQGIGTTVSLHPKDCDAIQNECTAVRDAVPLVKTSAVQLIYGSHNWSPSNVNGTTPAYLDIHNWGIASGRMFSDAENTNGARVCVIGQTVVRNLFEAGENPLGKSIRLNSVAFRVVGVLAKKGASMMGWDQDDTLLVPWLTLKRRISNSASTGTVTVAANSSVAAASSVNTLSQLFPSSAVSLYPDLSSVQEVDSPEPIRFPNISQILIAARGTREVPLAMHQIRQLLRDRHRVAAGMPDDFNMHDLTEFADAMNSMSSTMTHLLLAVALLSLFVGGVGIMNIMLVSVTERTREIGLRMAVGARSNDILQQFLTEAIILCLLGGGVGIVLGCGASWAVHHFLRYPTEVSIPAIIISVAVSATVGLIFGFYPAYKASKLDPIEALRYE